MGIIFSIIGLPTTIYALSPRTVILNTLNFEYRNIFEKNYKTPIKDIIEVENKEIGFRYKTTDLIIRTNINRFVMTNGNATATILKEIFLDFAELKNQYPQITFIDKSNWLEKNNVISPISHLHPRRIPQL